MIQANDKGKINNLAANRTIGMLPRVIRDTLSTK